MGNRSPSPFENVGPVTNAALELGNLTIIAGRNNTGKTYPVYTLYGFRLLIIDEPEGHLDTANQILLARLLARLVRAGPKIVLTTHSDYLVKEINNLVMLSRMPNRAAVARGLGYREDDHLAPDLIRAYVTEANGLTRCTIGRYGIEMPVFDTTIDGINKVANELSVRLVNTEDDAAGTPPG